MSTALRYRSYGKINLYLDVLERRGDGFHDIETIFQSVDLYDAMTFEARETGVSLACDAPGLETDGSNLICRAAAALQAATGSTAGAHVTLEKRIPVAAGMAGGSGNAAAALIGLNRLWRLGLDGEALAAIGLTLGSDVPFCLRGGTMAATGRGEVLTPLAACDGVWFVLVHPELKVSTASVYGSPHLVRNGSERPGGKTARFAQALDAYERRDWSGLVSNTMEQPVLREHPELGDILYGLQEAGCVTSAMSGSGPTLFGVCADKDAALAVATAMGDLRTTIVRPAGAGVVSEETET